MQIPPRPPDTGQQAVFPDSGQERPVFEEQQLWMDQQPCADQIKPPGWHTQEPEDGLQQTDSDDSLEKRNHSRVPKLLGTVLITAGLLFFLRYQVFTIKNVHVTGVRSVPWQTVAKAAGLDQSLLYFTLDEEAVRNGINSNRYLIFESMEKIFPNTLAIKVTERRPFAFFTHLGVGYILAQDGMILEQTRELRDSKELMTVNGLAVWGQQTPGSMPSSTDPAQAEGMNLLFGELSLWGFDTQVNSIDIAQSLNISMQTRDGYTINLGSADQLHAKVGTVFSVVSELRRRQMTGGIIEATLPGEATYRAE